MGDCASESPSSRGSFMGDFESYLKELEDELNLSINSLNKGSVTIGKDLMLTSASGDDDDNAMSEYLRRDKPDFLYTSPGPATTINTNPNLNPSSSAATFTPMSIRDILRQDEDGDSTVDRFLFALQDTMGSDKSPTPLKSDNPTLTLIDSSSASKKAPSTGLFGSAEYDDYYRPHSPQTVELPSSTEVYIPNNDHMVSYGSSSSYIDSPTGSLSSSLDDMDLSPAPRHGPGSDDQRIMGDFSFYGDKERLSREALKKIYCGISEAVVPSSRDPTVSEDPSLYSTLYLLECIIRPDIDLPRVMKCLELVALTPVAAPLDFYLHRTNHASMPFKEQPSLLSWAEGTPPDWDSIDVQVCISRELRQRVIVFQFMRKSASYNGTIKDFLSMYAEAPAREVFVKTVRNALTSSRLCLSDLYTMTASEVCLDGGLDVDFKIKLHHMCREGVWEDLKDDFHALDEHMKTVEVQCARFMATIDPIYKAHGLKMPPPERRKKLSDFPLSIDLAALNNVSNIEHEDEESDEEDENEEDCEDDYDNHDEVLEQQPARRTSLNLAMLGKAGTFNRLSSLGKLSASPLSEGPSLASKFTPNRKANHRGRDESDALAVCLSLLAHCTKILQRRCDVEITARLQQKNEYTVAIISDLCDYRKTLILHIARSAETFSSPLNKAYLKTFAGVDPIRTPPQVPARKELPVPTQLRKIQQEKLLMLDDYNEDGGGEGSSVGGGEGDDSAAALASYLYDSLLSSGAPAEQQRPAFAKPVLRSRSMEQVKARLEAYRRAAADSHGGDSLSTISSAERSKSLLRSLLPQGGAPLARLDGVHKMYDTIIYYCACLVGGVPGKLYLTPHYIGLSYGVLGISTAKELLPLSALSLVAFQVPGSSILAANALRLAFFGGRVEYSVSPVMVECNRLRTMIIDTCDSVKSEQWDE